MSRKLITMEQIKQILQLHNDGIGIREIARRTGLSRNSIKKYIGRVTINTDEPKPDLSDKQLASAAYENPQLLRDARRRENLITHFAYAEKELGKTGVTRQLLWIEYKEQYTDG